MAYDHCLRRAGVRALQAGLFCVLLVAPAWASQEDLGDMAEGNEPPPALVVSPGQEALISTMLGHGTALPDGCKFTGGSVDGGTILSTYNCPSGKVVFQLTHPNNAENAATETEDFAITVQSGAPPVELTDVLASMIRSHETDFAWISPDDEASRAAKSEP